MAGLVPFNRRGNYLAQPGAGLEDFYNTLDDFFSDNWLSGRDLLRDTFKIDIEETGDAYIIQAELPGIQKKDIELNVDNEDLCISVNHSEEDDKKEKNYIHQERRVTSMSRRVRLANANLGAIKANLDNGILSITVPKKEKESDTFKIEIN